MICTLSRNQQEATLKTLRRLVQINKLKTPEAILKNIYDVVYESFTKKDMQKDAQPYALSMAQYAAENLYLLLKEEGDGMRQLTSRILGTADQFTSEAIEKYKKEDELRKLLNLNKSELKALNSPIKEETVSKYMDTIKSSFPPISSRATFVRSEFPFHSKDFVLATTKDGKEIKMSSVSDYLNNSQYNKIPSDNLRTRIGSTADMVIRKFFAEPTSYPKFREKILKDKEFISSFRRFSENTNGPIGEITTTVRRYMEDYVDDMMYAINFIQSNYQDAHITDLSSLIDKSSLTPQQKQKFYIYSAEVGLRGELDLLAIRPDGTFTVIDVKTTDGNRNAVTDDKYAKQAAIYDLILSTGTGMKSSGNNDIIFLTTSISNPARVMNLRTETGFLKSAVTNYEKVSTPNVSPETLLASIQMYKKQIDLAYRKTDTVKTTNSQVKVFSPFDAYRAGSLKGRKKPLQSIFNPNDPLSTFESLTEGKKWLQSVFPELDDAAVQIMRIASSNAGGEFFIDAIKLYEKSNEGVAYHEGWHRFSQLYLTKPQKTRLYEGVQSDNITFTTRDGRTLSTSEASFLDVEEFLAEEFRKFAQDPSGYKFPTKNTEPKKWFQKIWAAIKAIAAFFKGNGTYAYEDLFRELYTGSYNRSNFSVNNAMFTHLNSFFRDTARGEEALDNATFLKFRDYTDYSISEYLKDNDLTIVDLTTAEGVRELNALVRDVLSERRSQLADTQSQLADAIINETDQALIESYKANSDNLSFYEAALDAILEQDSDGNYIRFSDYMRAIFKTSKFESLRKFAGKNQEYINRVIDEDNMAEHEKTEELGDNPKDATGETFDVEQDVDEPSGDISEFDNPGNLKSASDQAKAQLKDFFVGIPRRRSSDLELQSDPSIFEYDEGGLPITLSGQESFYKSLRVFQGSLTLDRIIQRLNTPSNYLVFPELLHIKEKLLGDGTTETKGLIPRFMDLTGLLNEGTANEEEKLEHARLMSFLMHFTHVMSMRNVDFETFTIKLNHDPLDENISRMPALFTRNNIESIVYSIMNDFTKGFRDRMDERFKNSDKNYVSIYDMLYNIFNSGQESLSQFMDQVGNEEFIYDPNHKKFYFNSLYVYKKFANVFNPTDGELKDFFAHLGITLNDKIYESKTDRKGVLDSYRKLKEMLFSFHRNSYEKLAQASAYTNVQNNVRAWKTMMDAERLTTEGSEERFAAAANRMEVEKKLRGFINLAFTDNPVEQMMYDGKDRKLMSNKKNRIFARNWPIFRELALIEKNYHKRFSSGSMIVQDKLQFSYFLPNTMLMTEMLINDHVNNVNDFGKYPELAHLDPTKNPQILNSYIFGMMFDQNGNKRTGMHLGVSNIAQLSVINTNDTVESKRMQDLKEDEKILFDFLMVKSEGSAEIRRLETSNTAYRLSLQNRNGYEKGFIKAVNIRSTEGFANAGFLSIVRNYIQHAAWKFQYHQDDNNSKKDAKYKGQNLLGVFDEMIPLAAGRIKTFIRDNEGDMNTLMNRIETQDPKLFTDINQGIAEYFEKVAIKNPDSYKEVFNKKLSQKGRTILAELGTRIDEKAIVANISGELADSEFRDFIANDFIMAMEDAMLFFGDYTYYKDPIKRRKIIGNNGSVNMVDDIMAAGIAAQQVESLTSIYHSAKNLTSNKNHKLVRKAVGSDVKMTSSLLDTDENGDMKLLKDLQLMRKQMYGEDISIAELAEEKKETIAAFTDMEVGDAAAWISLDTYRRMRMREMTWDFSKDEKEYRRQLAIMKENLEQPISEIERDLIDGGPYSAFNVAKFALTGPVYSGENKPFTPVFDKMGLRVLLPSMDWNRSNRYLFEKMLTEELDYYVLDTGSKVYQPANSTLFKPSGLVSTLNKQNIEWIEHAGGFFKYQQNTSNVNDKSTFSNQLRSIFHEIMLIQNKRGKISPRLQSAYNKMIKSLSDYITINSSRALTEMGLDTSGKIRDKATFVNYLKDRLTDIGGVDEQLIDLLSVNQNGEFSTFLEALPFQKNIIDMITGVVDDNFRKIKLNGTKFYQSPEIGTTISAKKIEDIPKEQRGTVELKWHALEIVDGKVLSTLPVECKINFRQQFYPLLNLKHPDGQKISTLKRLNEAIQNKEWSKSNYDSITFIGVRIPLQDINFSSHVIVKEFLPEEVGDMIIMPPEFYKQTGSDNDIDTVTATFKYLDANGKVIKRPQENYEDIINRISELSTVDDAVTVIKDDTLDGRVATIKQQFIDNEVFAKKGKGMDVMNREFTIVETEGYRTLAGLLDPKSTLRSLMKTKESNDYMELVYLFNESLNEGSKTIKSDRKKELFSLTKKRNNYIKGITNDIAMSIMEFMETPENFDYLTETDSITRVKEMAANMLTLKTNKEYTANDLAAPQTSLQAMSYIMNIVNHTNNFEMRTILGSIIKFRSLYSMMHQIGTVIQPEYIGGSVTELVKRVAVASPFAQQARKTGKQSESTYARKLYTPLLYKKDVTNGVEVSIFDENGERATKNLSMIASSLLDLFKNMDVFPSLGLSWMNVKPLIFLVAQGVPMERAILFLNNPVVQAVQDELRKLGTDARDKHALVSLAQSFSGDDIFLSAPYRWEVYTTDAMGRQSFNTRMKRLAPAAESYLKGRPLRFTETILTSFAKDYGEYINSPDRISGTRNLASFLDKNANYKELAMDITAYYALLLEDGDLLYTYGVKGLNRNTAKMGSKAALALARTIKQARQVSGLFNADFDEKLENNTTHSPFYKDATIQNVINNAMPNLLDNPDKYFNEKFSDMVERITSKVFGNPEYRRKVEMTVMSDFTEFIYKQFYFMQGKNGTGNTLYEHYQFDITPLLGPLMGKEKYKKFMEDFSKQMEARLSEDVKIENLYNEGLLANQIDIFKAKYPELRRLTMIDQLLAKKEPGIDPKKTNSLEIKDVLNMLTQSYIIINMSTNPKDREADEMMIRDEWKKLASFKLSNFPSIEADIAQNPDRLAFYENLDNILEIRQFFKNLAFYSLAQSSHLSKGQGAFSYMAPTNIIKDVVEKSITNFNRFLQTSGSMFEGLPAGNEAERQKTIDRMLNDFEVMFRDMNGELNWSDSLYTPKPVVVKQETEEEQEEDDEAQYLKPNKSEKSQELGLPYRKAHTGKLYSKISMPGLDLFKRRIALELGIKDQGYYNRFRLDMDNSDENPLNCSL